VEGWVVAVVAAAVVVARRHVGRLTPATAALHAMSVAITRMTVLAPEEACVAAPIVAGTAFCCTR